MNWSYYYTTEQKLRRIRENRKGREFYRNISGNVKQ